MPFLIILQREHIYQQLEIVHSRLTNHVYLIIDLISSHILQKARKFLKLRFGLRWIITHLHPETHIMMEMRHKVKPCPQIDMVTNGRRQIKANTCRSQCHRSIQMLEKNTFFRIIL